MYVKSTSEAQSTPLERLASRSLELSESRSSTRDMGDPVSNDAIFDIDDLEDTLFGFKTSKSGAFGLTSSTQTKTTGNHKRDLDFDAMLHAIDSRSPREIQKKSLLESNSETTSIPPFAKDNGAEVTARRA